MQQLFSDLTSDRDRLSPKSIVFSIVCVFVVTFGCSNKEKPTSTAQQTGKANQSSDRSVSRDSIGNKPSGDTTSKADDAVAVDAFDRDQQLELAVSAQEQGRHDKAIEILRQLMIRDPNDSMVIFYLANSESMKGNLQYAVELLSQIPPSDPEAGLPSLGIAADWYQQLGQFDKAIEHYQRILSIDPSAHIARRPLAYLLNRQGRRHEANRMIRELCKSGDIMQDELFSLIVETDAMYDSPDEASTTKNDRPYLPIGPLGEARHLVTEQKLDEAEAMLRPLVESEKASPAALAFYGLVCTEMQQEERFKWWLGKVTEETKQFPEYWFAVGTYLLSETRYRDAVGALAECLRKDPSSNRCVRRLIQAFRSLRLTREREALEARHRALNRVIDTANEIAASDRPNVESYIKLSDELALMGRPLESILWRSMIVNQFSDSKAIAQQLGVAHRQIVTAGESFPSDEECLGGIDLSDYPIPAIEVSKIASSAIPQSGSGANVPVEAMPASFRNVASQVGLDHTYAIATGRREKALAIYQTLGGGVAVLDFDLDGWADLFLAQGFADPPDFKSERPDLLYRHLRDGDQSRLVSCFDQSGISEKQYTRGVTSGDWNQDGLPDLAIGLSESVQILINCGDGTFHPMPLRCDVDFKRCNSSIAMGDVTGDQLPDLIELNYIKGDDIYRYPDVNAEGYVEMPLSPLDFTAAHDFVYVQTANGDHQRSNLGISQEDACTGLGVILADIDGKTGNKIFIANDLRRNQLWVHDSDGGFSDQGIAMGCAYGAHSLATGAMGIAVADFDRTGTLDIHVTNYADESNSLYLQSGGLFRDLSTRYRIKDVSVPLVGFGTQALDYDNNGWQDIVVTNGHVDDVSHQGKAFQQPTQLFANLGNRFELIGMGNDSYLDSMHLGRGLALLDFNRDGRQDFVVTNIQEPSALLINESPGNHHWIRIKLVGSISERDAIGARVTVFADDEVFHHWVVGGDGYLSKNESTLHIGLGKVDSIDRIVVDWPSREQTTLTDVMVNQTLLLVETQEPFRLEVRPSSKTAAPAAD